MQWSEDRAGDDTVSCINCTCTVSTSSVKACKVGYHFINRSSLVDSCNTETCTSQFDTACIPYMDTEKGWNLCSFTKKQTLNLFSWTWSRSFANIGRVLVKSDGTGQGWENVSYLVVSFFVIWHCHKIAHFKIGILGDVILMRRKDLYCSFVLVMKMICRALRKYRVYWVECITKCR